MTKTLTEQWREGTLPVGIYYIVNKNGYEEIDKSVAVGELWNNTDLKEVLAPVPSYDEWQSYEKCADMLIDVNKKWEKTIKEKKQLEKRLEIATKALEEYAEIETYDWVDSKVVALKALKEMEGVK